MLVRALMLCVLAVSAAGAQLPADETLRQYFRALEERRWRDATLFMDLERVEEIRQQALRAATDPRFAYRPPTAEDFMRRDSTMTRAVAEYSAAQAARVQVHRPTLADRFAGVDDPDSLAALPLDVAAALMLEAGDGVYRMRRRFITAGCDSIPPSAVLEALSDPARHNVIGAVIRDSVAYGLYQQRTGYPFRGLHPATPRLARIRLRDGMWKVVEPGFTSWSGMNVDGICLPASGGNR